MKSILSNFKLIIPFLILMILFLGNCTQAQNSSNDSELDDKVKDFLDSRRSSGSQAYLEYVQSLDNYNTTVDDSGGGVAISYKK